MREGEILPVNLRVNANEEILFCDNKYHVWRSLRLGVSCDNKLR